MSSTQGPAKQTALDAFIATVTPHFQTLTNSYVVQHINTGDRVKDGALVIILNTVISLISSNLYKVVIEIIKWLVHQFGIGRDTSKKDGPTNIDIKGFDFTNFKQADIIKYKYVMTFYSSSSKYMTSDEIMPWLEQTFNHMNTNTFIRYQYALQLKETNKTSSKGQLSLYEGNSNTAYYINNLFMPIWKYHNKQKNQLEYIWISNGTIYANDYNELHKLMETIREFYKIKHDMDILSNKNMNKPQGIYELNSDTSGDNTTLAKLSTLNTNQVFDTMFFDDKARLIDILDKFKSANLYPKGLSLTNKLGVLLYGPPGTGKTGTIAAVANYLKRDIVMINALNNYTLSKTLKWLSKQTELLKTSILVFDEFDCILQSCTSPMSPYDAHNFAPIYDPYFDYDAQQNTVDASTSAENVVNEPTAAKTDKKPESVKTKKNSWLENIKKIKEMRESDSVGAFLKFLDGIGSSEDRLIIATTNHPEKIDPRLLRPGRFDLKLELSYCSFQMFCDLVEKVYPDYIAAIRNTLSTTASAISVDINIEIGGAVGSVDKPAPDNQCERIGRVLKNRITPMVLINTLAQFPNNIDDVFYALENNLDLYT